MSNGSVALEGVDGRSALARRFRDVERALLAELGGDVDDSTRLQAKTAAGLQVHAESLTAALVRGESVDGEALTRAANAATRAVAALRRRTRSSPARVAASPLTAYLGSKGAAG